MYSLQELIEHGYVDSITTDGTHWVMVILS